MKLAVLLLSVSSLFSVALSLSGCVESVTPQEQAHIANSDPMTAAIADKAVDEYIHTTFKDPYSVQDLTIGTPYIQKSYKGLVNGGGYAYVWCIPFSCNGKNSYGAYIGIRRLVALYSDGKVIGGYQVDPF